MDWLITRLLRTGRNGAREVQLDLVWLCALVLVMIATGIGLRDPWPADEPRFALIARDMLANHQWLIPQVGGDVYADKPPLFFWLIALGLSATGSMRLAFLLPSLLAAFGCVVLVYDLARRLWDRETGLAAALLLLFSVQFVWQARQAQIDATLCFFTTLSLYGLLRHCLLGPQWKWYAIGWAAAGIGIITKGVGFLPLLMLIPYAMSRVSGWQPRPVIHGGWRWMLGPLSLLAAVSVWLVPMLLAAQSDPSLRLYRDEILFGQTLDRYADAWQHRQPFWYFIVEVIPGLWLPLTALLPWLIPRWRESLRQRDLRMLLPLVWVALVLLFFSFSTGKRGVYVLPALPALVLAAAPWLASIAQQRAAQWTLFATGLLVAAGAVGGAVWLMGSSQRLAWLELYAIDGFVPLLTFGLVSAGACFAAGPRRGFAVWGMTLATLLLVVSFLINPRINDSRSGADLMQRLAAMTAHVDELGVVAYREQYLLHVNRPVTNFGHARWRDRDQEAADAASWLSRQPGRALLVNGYVREHCFASVAFREVGFANRERWFLVEGSGADPVCVRRGKASAAILYVPPTGVID